jgi:phosphatidylglycerol:prolipoprotein diacylglycerol transferase
MEKFIIFWKHIPEYINSVAFSIGPIQVHYYGIMYLLAFLTAYLLVLYRLKTEKFAFKKEVIDNYFIWLIISLLIGGRIGYVLFYNLAYYLKYPLEIILPFDVNDGFRYIGLYGMSYHGALIGIIAASVIFCRKFKANFWLLADLFIPAVPLGYTFGRLGNFINGELYGRVTTVSWGMYFPLDSMHRLRHPSQLYEALFEGVFLFVILWSVRKKIRIPGGLFSLYLIGYGVIRFFLEFFRQPDQQLGFVVSYLTMGQILCLIMATVGLILLIKQHRFNLGRRV